jgi:hypothetical protein
MWLVGCAVLTVARAAVPESSAAATILTDGTPVLSAGAIVAGVLIHRPEPALPWFLMLTALLSGMAGNIVLMINTARGAIAFPSLSDVFWLLEYPILVAAVMMFIRGFGWRRDRAGILDTLIISTGLGLATWLLFIRDLVGHSALPLDARLVGIACPLADLLLLSAMVRFLTASARAMPPSGRSPRRSRCPGNAGGRLGSEPRAVGDLGRVRGHGRVDLGLEEPGERQGAQRLRHLLLVLGDDLEEGRPPGRRNVVGADLPGRAQRLQLLLLVRPQGVELREVRVGAKCRHHHERCRHGRSSLSM